jgi:hypothetical protein
VLVNVAHVLIAAELAVGHIEEIGAAGGLAQRLPAFDVRNRVVGKEEAQKFYLSAA